ncbi:hypothetical protein BDN72DRAFT_891122 [Pluteus cervinus]|uniref:Uncharacterized protein n=1 Tax=Pluteus cervinus TaxID=181527 RepID=A0ACD3BGY3_9AGAR|nr:hypothetical protein BDN72DRAFT_891122 [Pluteus cervinus]
MLNPRLGVKPGEGTTSPRRSTEATHGTSKSGPTPNVEERDPAAKLKQALRDFSSPHDEVLSQLYGQPLPSDSAPVGGGNAPTGTGVVDANRPVLTPILMSRSQSSNRDRLNALGETLYDPFDGTPIGPLVAPDSSLSNDTNDDALWSHLSKIVDLQNQVAHKHTEMEGVGSKSGDAKGKHKATTKVVPTPYRGGAPSVGDGDGGDNDADEGDDDDDEESNQERLREEEFARLAGQFDGRKKAIGNIMKELEDLSKALTNFHALQAPKIEFPSQSRNNTSSTFPESVPTTPPSNNPVHILPSGSIVPPAPLSRVTPRTNVPTLIVNTVEPGRQGYLSESPLSFAGTPLPREGAPT